MAAGVAGQLKVSADDYPYTLDEPTQDLIPYLSLELTQKQKFNKAWRAQWKLYGLSNPSSKYAPENFYGDVQEAFIEAKAGAAAKWRLGMNTVNWAVVDVSSPSDTVNTLVLFHPLRTLKQGAPMFEQIYGQEALNINLIYIPIQRAPVLPSTDSRWLPRQFLLNAQTAQGRIVIPKFMEYKYDKQEVLDHALNNNFGAKLASHMGSFDVQITHFEGAAPNPKARATVDLDFLTARSPLHIAPVVYRVRTTGMGFVWAREKWIYRGETAYQHTISDDPLLQPWSWASVLGAETNIDMGSSTLTLLGQYYYTRNPQAPDNFVSSAYRLFDRTAIAGGRWAYSETLTILFSALYETQTQGLFWMAGFDRKLSESMRWGLAWRDFSAQREGLIKTFDHNDHATFEMTYYF